MNMVVARLTNSRGACLRILGLYSRGASSTDRHNIHGAHVRPGSRYSRGACFRSSRIMHGVNARSGSRATLTSNNISRGRAVAAHQSHKLEVVGSSPTPATNSAAHHEPDRRQALHRAEISPVGPGTPCRTLRAEGAALRRRLSAFAPALKATVPQARASGRGAFFKPTGSY